MKKKKKKGFTLIELLGVILIIVLLSLIVVPLTFNIIDKVKKETYRTSVYGIVKAAENDYYLDKYVTYDTIFIYKNGVETSNREGRSLDYDGRKPLSGHVVVTEEGDVALALYNGKWCATKDLDDSKVGVAKSDGTNCYLSYLMPKIELLGKTEMNLEIKTTYIEPGYKGFNSLGEEVTESVNIQIKKDELNIDYIDSSQFWNYKVIYSVEEDGLFAEAIRTVNIVDTTPPVLAVPEDITILPNEVETFDLMEGVSVTDNSEEEIEVTISGNVSIIPGSYIITYSATDSSLNKTEVLRTINVVDTIGPNANFSINGDSTWRKQHSPVVNINDEHSLVNLSSLKYLWSTKSSNVIESEITNTFTNGSEIISPNGVTGVYYLWVIAKDNSNNTSIIRSELFNIDNTPPTITLNGAASMSINKGSTYTELGANATDEHSGINGSVSITGLVNTNTSGTYTITYSISDNALNTTAVNRTVIVKNPTVTEYRYRDYNCNGSCKETKCKQCIVYNPSVCEPSHHTPADPQYGYCSQTSCTLCGTECISYSKTWCSWSAWSRTPVTPSGTRQVETREVEI